MDEMEAIYIPANNSVIGSCTACFSCIFFRPNGTCLYDDKYLDNDIAVYKCKNRIGEVTGTRILKNYLDGETSRVVDKMMEEFKQN